jgi:two-component system phosphate regulon sensor histidine kinase PhoR
VLRRRLKAAQATALTDIPDIPVETSSVTNQRTFPALFHAAAAALDDGLVAVSPDRQVRFLNPQAEELLGIDAQTVLGQGLIALLRDYQADVLVREVLEDGEVRETTMQPVLSGRTLRLRCTPLQVDGEVNGALLFIRDVTQISRLERARRDLVANVSHELRTPLASLKLLIETLQSEPPPTVARRMLDQAAHEVDAVAQLVDELHELSQIESGRVTLQLSPAPVDEAVQRALARILPQAERKSLQVTSSLPEALPIALMDSDRIGQVLLNLLHNAVKFTPEHGTIEVSVRQASIDTQSSKTVAVTPLASSEETQRIEATNALPPGQWLLVAVKDTGVGIPSQDVQRIFERFYKVDRARSRNQGGTGLGLAIAKHLVEGHGGRLWAASTEGKGSTFYFLLPLA